MSNMHGPTRYTTPMRSALVPMMKHSIEELIKVAEAERLDQHPKYYAVIGHAKGVLNEIDFEMRKAPHFVPDEEVAAMYLSGMSLYDLGVHFGRAHTWARNVLKRVGVPIRKRGSGSKFPRGHIKEASARTKEMIELWNLGKTLEQIGHNYGITRERVRQLLIREGIDTTNRPLTPEQKRFVQEYVNGRSLTEVAARAKSNPDTVRGWLRKEGVPVRPSRKQRKIQPQTKENAKLAAQWYREGVSVEEIGKRLGYQSKSGGSVYRLLAYAGVKLDRRIIHREHIKRLAEGK